MRKQISLTAPEMVAFLEGRHHGTLATIGSDGLPHQVTISYAVVGSTVRFTTFSKAQKAVNAKRNPSASLLVEVAAPYSAVKGVLVRGEIQISDDYDHVLDTVRRVAKHIQQIDPENWAANPDVDFEATARKRVSMTLSLERVTTWDHAKLGVGVY